MPLYKQKDVCKFNRWTRKLIMQNMINKYPMKNMLDLMKMLRLEEKQW